MANIFYRKLSRNIGNIATAIGNYSVGPNIGAVVIGVTVSNTLEYAITANVKVTGATNNFYLIRNTPIAAYGAISVVGRDHKLILQSGDSINVDTNGNVTAVMSIMETDSAGISTDLNPLFQFAPTATQFSNPGSSTARLGYSMAVSGQYTVISAPIESTNQGRVYVYKTSEASPTYTLLDPSATNYDEFGTSVAMDGKYIVAGSPNADGGQSNQGNVYIYDTTVISAGNVSSATRTIPNPDPVKPGFGSAVGISGNNVIVGHSSGGSGTNGGIAYIFSAATGNLLYTLNNPNLDGSANSDYFGGDVDISGNIAIVGASGEASTAGNAYIYNLSTFSGNIINSANYNLYDPNVYGTPSFDTFGVSVAVDGNYVVVGANAEDSASGSSTGAAYVYNITTFSSNTIYSATNALTAPSALGGAAGDEFGWSVDIKGDVIAVGAKGESRVYVYDRASFASNIISTANRVLTDLAASGNANIQTNFGYTVSAGNTRVVVGAVDTGTNFGNVYNYHY